MTWSYHTHTTSAALHRPYFFLFQLLMIHLKLLLFNGVNRLKAVRHGSTVDDSAIVRLKNASYIEFLFVV